MARYEHEQLVLVGMLGRRDPASLVALLGEADKELAASAPLTARFYALDDDTPDDEFAKLIGELVAHLRPVLARLADLPPVDAQTSALMDELNERMLRPAQRDVLRRVQRRLTQPDET
jgi:hypothetical protein